LLGDGRATLEVFFENNVKKGAGDTFPSKTVVFIEVFVFNGNSGIFDIIRQIFELDGGAILVSIDFVEELAISVKDLSRDREGARTKFARRGEVFENGDGEDEDDKTSDSDDEDLARIFFSKLG